MRPTVHRRPLQRAAVTARAIARPTRTAPRIERAALPAVVPQLREAAPWALASGGPNPYLEYSRELTPQGGIAITYRTVDLRLRQKILKFIIWSLITAASSLYVFNRAAIENFWMQVASAVAIGAVAKWIVDRQVETTGSIEIRPDGIIIDGRDMFRLRHMERGWPAFRANEDGTQTLAGIYGTRQIEYFTIKRVDPNDRTPEILAAHLQDAMRQLWSWPH